jgi:hypothetical protein
MNGSTRKPYERERHGGMRRLATDVQVRRCVPGPDQFVDISGTSVVSAGGLDDDLGGFHDSDR